MKDRHLWYPQLCTDLVLILALMFGASSFGFAQTVDTTPPEIVDLSFAPTEVDVSASEQVVTVTVHTIDDLSGVSSSSFNLYAAFMGPSATFSGGLDASLISGDPLDGVWETDVTIPQWSENGTWTLYQVFVRDNAGNYAFYDSAYLTASGFPTQLTVASAVSDTTPPEVVDISFSPPEVNVSTNDQLVTMRIHIMDDLSGVGLGTPPSGYGDVVLASPSFTTPIDGTPVHILYGAGDFHRVSGDLQDGIWEASFVLPAYSPAGDWTIYDLRLSDLAHNSIEYHDFTAQALVSDGLFVISDNEDLSPPQLLDFDLNPRFVTVTESNATIQSTLQLTDDRAGIDLVNMGARSPSNAQGASAWATLKSGTELDGEWTADISIPQYAETGTWTVSSIRLHDAVGNHRLLLQNSSEDDLGALGFESTFVVTQPSLVIDDNVDPIGATVVDDDFPDRALVTFPPDAVGEPTDVAIDVFVDPLELPIPTGFAAPGTYYVNIDLEPEPATFPLPPPGITVVLPLANPMSPGSSLVLYKVDPNTGDLVPAASVYGGEVTGFVDDDGLSATFTGVAGLSTVVGLIKEDTDDDGDGVENETDLCPETLPGATADINGCSIDQLCPCEVLPETDEAWENHGNYVSCVSHACEEFLELGLITEAEKDATVSAAAQSECGKK